MSLFTELKRRNVFRMAALYAVAGWLIMQVAEVVIGLAGLPLWTGQALLAVLAIGFPIALIFSWFYELTPEGLSLEKDVEAHESITHVTGQRINFLVISLLCAGLVVFAIDKWWLRDPTEPADAAAPVAYSNSVAVLAFDDLSPEGDQSWFSDGLSEEIINSLTQLPELKVTARTSAFHFKGLDLPIPEIAATLGVAHVVEGSVRRAGDRMRVTAQLIKADDGFHLWSETYNRSTDDVFTVQEDIAANIAAALEIYLDEERREKMFQIGTRNVQAYEAYLRGLEIYNDWHWSSMRLESERAGGLWGAQGWFERALEYDPEFAQAHFYHGEAFLKYAAGILKPQTNSDTDLTPETAVNFALRDHQQAIESAPSEELRVFYQTERTLISDNWSGLRSLLEELLSIREKSTLPIFSRKHDSDAAIVLLGRSGLESNYRHFRRNFERDPLSWSSADFAARYAIYLGKFDEAQELIDEKEKIYPGHTNVLRYRLMIETGRYNEFLEEITTTPYLGARALALVLTGRHDEAHVQIEKLLPESRWRTSAALLAALRELGENERAAEFTRDIDNVPGMSNIMLLYLIENRGGKLTWELEWTPKFKARLQELGVELEAYEFPPPAD